MALPPEAVRRKMRLCLGKRLEPWINACSFFRPIRSYLSELKYNAGLLGTQASLQYLPPWLLPTSRIYPKPKIEFEMTACPE
jgi:hypothetical protein